MITLLLKPDPAIFRILLRRYRLAAEETLFIDDNAHNVAAAAALGFVTHHFRDGPALARHLTELDLL